MYIEFAAVQTITVNKFASVENEKKKKRKTAQKQQPTAATTATAATTIVNRQAHNP